MAGNAADISLASNALILLGHEPISSFEETTAGAQVAANLYDHSYKSILTTHRWRFATKQAKLARLSAEPQNVYKYQFQMPTDLLYMIRVVNVREYEVYEDKVYSHQKDIDIEYIYEIDSDRLPSYYAKMFEYYLASQFSIPITGDIDKASFYSQQYEKALIKAKFADSSQRPNDAFVDSPYTDVRH